MKMSRRARRMERHHKRNRSGGSLNVVSLMDIFTILVFFLLVHSSNVESIPSAKSIKLPESVAEKAPKQTVVIAVSDEDILVQGRKILATKDVLEGGDEVLSPLKAELDYQAGRATIVATAGGQREVTIMGDKEIHYRLLKKIMQVCVRAGYENISLAVTQKEG